MRSRKKTGVTEENRKEQNRDTDLQRDAEAKLACSHS